MLELDKYTKAILTVIAASLATLALSNVHSKVYPEAEKGPLPEAEKGPLSGVITSCGIGRKCLNVNIQQGSSIIPSPFAVRVVQ
jgi:hypothetical protein